MSVISSFIASPIHGRDKINASRPKLNAEEKILVLRSPKNSPPSKEETELPRIVTWYNNFFNYIKKSIGFLEITTILPSNNASRKRAKLPVSRRLSKPRLPSFSPLTSGNKIPDAIARRNKKRKAKRKESRLSLNKYGGSSTKSSEQAEDAKKTKETQTFAKSNLSDVTKRSEGLVFKIITGTRSKGNLPDRSQEKAEGSLTKKIVYKVFTGKSSGNNSDAPKNPGKLNLNS